MSYYFYWCYIAYGINLIIVTAIAYTIIPTTMDGNTAARLQFLLRQSLLLLQILQSVVDCGYATTTITTTATSKSYTVTATGNKKKIDWKSENKLKTKSIYK